jgi:hypothetical protein
MLNLSRLRVPANSELNPRCHVFASFHRQRDAALETGPSTGASSAPFFCRIEVELSCIFFGCAVSHHRKAEAMDKERVKRSAQQAKGAVKEAAGKITGDAKLQAEGKADKDCRQDTQRDRRA